MVLGGADDPWTTWVSTTASVFTLTGTWGCGQFPSRRRFGMESDGCGCHLEAAKQMHLDLPGLRHHH